MIRSLISKASLSSSSRLTIRQCNPMRASSSLPPRKERFFPSSEYPTDTMIQRQNSSAAATDDSNTPNTIQFEKVAFLGTGKMAQAIMSPLIQTGLQPAEKVSIFDVSVAQMKQASEQNPGVVMAQSIPELVDGADLLVCAVKPQNITEGLCSELRKANIPENATLLSVIAGLPLDMYYATGYQKIVRSMPNTPAMIGRGMTVWCCTENMTVNERDGINQVLGCLGKTIFVDEEKYVDMSTSISGSGPAYIFMLMEAMIDAGVHMGFPRDKATTLVYHTLLGSTLYAMETGEHPAILRNNVTSPSGTTASALYELENGRFRTVIKDAMWACYRRSLEMGGHESNVGPGRAPVPEGRVIQQFLDDHDDLKVSIQKKGDASDHEPKM
ncbi:Pyrroline-5-carboxylate reductase [Seminavis robusta]|uniref:Pyrroline-5-carboxylate reductase n=1 Tax=Seminavis robusta TaxID=568900 RepID=A0A9N8H978_9STRA|nr:Pyrroline-5-carboxylate reductase [Seminavis robusta]|eukprot:Sro110_g054770.1 Pyrroline-5-carboxylate reductase (385) ;mRNA; f:17290-18616